MVKTKALRDGKTFRLGDYLERYLASRTDLRSRTLELKETKEAEAWTSEKVLANLPKLAYIQQNWSVNYALTGTKWKLPTKGLL